MVDGRQVRDALQFNGSNALVTVNDTPSLDLTSGMTLEAWVNPSQVGSSWEDAIYKGGTNDSYFLEAYPLYSGTTRWSPSTSAITTTLRSAIRARSQHLDIPGGDLRRVIPQAVRQRNPSCEHGGVRQHHDGPSSPRHRWRPS